MKPLRAHVGARWLRVAGAVAATGVMGGLLVATIYWTLYDPMWLAFLGGVLFAGIAAMASRASRAEWTIMRRTRQLERARAQLTEETARSRYTADALRIAESRMRLLGDALPTMVLFVDRDERCRYHNRAAAQHLALPAERIDGRPLREAIGDDLHRTLAPGIAEALAGRIVDRELARGPGPARDATFAARLVPYPAADPAPQGFYLLLTPSMPRPAGGTAAPERGEARQDAEESGESLYLRAITDQLMGSDDPRAKLSRALEEDQFLLFAQKILPLKAGLPECCEVLLRLREEEDNLLPPGGFLPVAERYGMMGELDRWVVRSVIKWCLEKRASDPGWRQPVYCINLSEAAVSDPEFARFVATELRDRRLEPGSLCFEIAEPEVIGRPADVRRFIGELKPAGCRFTVDAFGSVKASFSQLAGLAFDFVKIDGVIIQNILRNPVELARARAISAVCGRLGMRAIAEFVETPQTLARLREIGVDYAQGFGIARPGPIDQIR